MLSRRVAVHALVVQCCCIEHTALFRNAARKHLCCFSICGRLLLREKEKVTVHVAIHEPLFIYIPPESKLYWEIFS